MSKSDVWMAFYVNDYVGDTITLTTQQHGAYLLLILSCWKNGGWTPADDLSLAATTKMTSSDWHRAKRVLARYFIIESDRWRHDRVERELERAQRVSDARREQGQKGGRPRKQTESNGKPIGLANGNLNGLQTETHAHVALQSHRDNLAPKEREIISGAKPSPLPAEGQAPASRGMDHEWVAAQIALLKEAEG